jgi:predicted nucleic acid-binding protein
VTRYLLDTNIISEISRPQPQARLADWFASRPASELFVATLTIAEIWRGILELARGRRRNALERWFAGREGPQALFQGRILPFDEKAAIEWGRIMAEGRGTGRSRSPLDMIIAAIAVANDCVVVTANERHFAGAVELLNPIREEG